MERITNIANLSHKNIQVRHQNKRIHKRAKRND
jgi:hypothetical protein